MLTRLDVFRRWLISLLHRPRLPDVAESLRAESDDSPDGSASPQGDLFQPIRSQEEIQEEEAVARANSMRTGIISRIFENDVPGAGVKNRPSHRADEAP